jgi:hypothetical protein
MKIMEFYSPEADNMYKLRKDDTRKHRLTLKEINKLRKVREIAELEDLEHEKFVKVMYAPPVDDQTV